MQALPLPHLSTLRLSGEKLSEWVLQGSVHVASQSVKSTGEGEALIFPPHHAVMGSINLYTFRLYVCYKNIMCVWGHVLL